MIKCCFLMNCAWRCVKGTFFELKSRQRNIRRKEKRTAFAVRLVS